MEEETVKIDLDNKIKDRHKRKLQSGIITDIISYTYGENRTVEQIAKYLNLHIIKTQYYLDYMVKEGVLEESIQPVVDGIINKTYRLIHKQTEANIKIDSEKQLILESKQFGSLVERMISSMRGDKLYTTQATGAMLNEEYAVLIQKKIQELHNLQERFEKESFESGKPVKQYNLVSVYSELEEKK